MSTPKYETIRRHAGNGDMVVWLHERNLLTDEERDRLHARIRRHRNNAYARVYSREIDACARYVDGAEPLGPCVECGVPYFDHPKPEPALTTAQAGPQEDRP